jgi:hypothetical protein
MSTRHQELLHIFIKSTDDNWNSVRLKKGKFAICKLLPPFQNIRCFSFVKQMYLDIF